MFVRSICIVSFEIHNEETLSDNRIESVKAGFVVGMIEAYLQDKVAVERNLLDMSSIKAAFNGL